MLKISRIDILMKNLMLNSVNLIFSHRLIKITNKLTLINLLESKYHLSIKHMLWEHLEILLNQIH